MFQGAFRNPNGINYLPFDEDRRIYPSYTCLNLEQKNLSNVDKEIQVHETFSNNFIDNCEKFKVSVTRMQIPSSLLESFDITPEEQAAKVYNVMMKYNNFGDGHVSSYDFPLFSNNTDNSNLSTQESTLVYGPTKFYSRESMVDNINKCFDRIHAQFIYDPLNSSITPSTSVYYKILSTNLTPSFPAPLAYSYSDSNTQACIQSLVGMTGGQKVLRVEIKISNFSISNGGKPYKVQFFTGNSKTITLFHGSASKNISGMNKLIHFEDNAIQNIKQYDNTSNVNVYSSEESYQSYDWDIPTGNSSFGILVNSQGTWTASLSTIINVYVNNLNYVGPFYPEKPPYIDFNTDKTKLQFNTELNTRLSDTEIYFSRPLNSLYKFDEYYYLDATTNYYRLILDTIPLIDEAGNKLMTITQQLPTVFALQNLNRLIIESNLPMTNEILLTNTSTDAPSSVLTDFIIDQNTPLETLIYAYGNAAVPYKSYDLSGHNMPLNGINLNVFVIYSNGIKKQLFYKPNEIFYIAISFFRKD